MIFKAAIFLGLSCTTLAQATDEAKTRSVKARTLELQIPADWKQQKTTSSMRAAQFAGPDGVEFVVFYFGGPTGGIKANIDRWVGQFAKDDLKLKMTEGKCDAGSYILVDCKGTWNKPDGPPFARKTKATPNSRVINVIVVEELAENKKDYYFLKLSGSSEAVEKQLKAVRASIGADMEKETEFKL